METVPLTGGGPQLLVFWEGGSVRRPLIPGSRVVLGRGEECDVRLDHPSVSRQHVAIVLGDEVRVVDLGSSNGTRVGGMRIAPNESVPLAPGMLVELGAAMLMVRADSDVAPASTRPGVLADPMEPIIRLAHHVARSAISVILLGETGSGKEVMAERIHRESPRAAKALVKINCAALPEQLLEAELFGYDRGAFTGAVAAKQGLLEAADGGTLFLDEVGELPLSTQAKLLRIVENRELTRLGAVKARGIDVRFIAATNRDLEALVDRGLFREDLFYRLNGISIAIPPLRERREEIARLARVFTERACRDAGRPMLDLSGEVLAVFHRHSWPGNVRELRNTIERAIVLADGGPITPAHLVGMRSESSPPRASARPSERAEASSPVLPPAGSSGRTLRADVADVERARILEALEQCAGNQTKAAQALGISRRTLLRRLDGYAVRRPRKTSS